MKFKQLFPIAILVVLVWACDDGGDPTAPPPTLTNAEKIAKTWQVDQAFIDGQNVTSTGNFGSFRITFRATGGNASTYSVTPGNAPSKPNWNSPDTGNWSFSAGTSRINFGGNEANVIGGISEERLTLEWKLPLEEDKLEPTYRFELVPN